MIYLYRGTTRVGVLTESQAEAFRAAVADWGALEFRDESGRQLGTFCPTPLDGWFDTLPPDRPPPPLPPGPWLTVDDLLRRPDKGDRPSGA